MLRQHTVVGVGSAVRLAQSAAPTSTITRCCAASTMRVKALQHRIPFLYRQQRQDVGVGHDALAQPQVSVMAQNSRQPAPIPGRANPLAQNKAASSALMAASPVLMSEKTMPSGRRWPH